MSVAAALLFLSSLSGSSPLVSAHSGVDQPAVAAVLPAAARGEARLAYRSGRFWHVASYRTRVVTPAAAVDPTPRARPRARQRHFDMR